MAKQKGATQKGFLHLSGSLGDTTFVASKDGFRAKQKISISKPRRNYHSDFALQRLKQDEFTECIKAGKLLRHSIGVPISLAQDSKMETRLVSEMMKVLKLEGNPKRFRNSILPANLDLLLGFNFNNKVRLRSVFNVGCKADINRGTGVMAINISSFIPSSAIKAPKLTSHFTISSAAIEIDFAENYVQSKVYESEALTFDSNPTLPITMVHNMTPNSNKTLMLLLGIRFIDETSNIIPRLLCKQNPLCIVALNKVP